MNDSTLTSEDAPEATVPARVYLVAPEADAETHELAAKYAARTSISRNLFGLTIFCAGSTAAFYAGMVAASGVAFLPWAFLVSAVLTIVAGFASGKASPTHAQLEAHVRVKRIRQIAEARSIVESEIQLTESYRRLADTESWLAEIREEGNSR